MRSKMAGKVAMVALAIFSVAMVGVVHRHLRILSGGTTAKPSSIAFRRGIAKQDGRKTSIRALRRDSCTRVGSSMNSEEMVPAAEVMKSLKIRSTDKQTSNQRMAAQKAMEISKIAENPAILDVIFAEDYIPADLTEALKNKRLAIISRSAQVVSRLGGFIAKALLLYSTGNLESSKTALAEELKQILISLGPSFVKFGQALSTRPDVTPPEFIEVLSGLQDRLPSFPRETAIRQIEMDFGKSIDQMFSSFSEEPVAAASLGQVYKGTLMSGEDVAVKIQRPDIATGIAIDMLLLRSLTQWVDDNINIGPLKTSVLVPLVDEFAARLFGELDYEKEGRSAERFRELYAGQKGLENVTAPKIYWDTTSKRVLTMEWIDGVKLTERERIENLGFDVIELVDTGVQCTLRQLLQDGFFHADPHPGNLLVTREGKLCYIDFGMMSTIPERARYALISHVVHLVNRDYEAMCEDYYDLEFMDRKVDTQPIAPALANFFDDALAYSVSELNFGALIDGLGEVFFEYPFQLPPYYALILRSLTFLEGLALRTDPNYKLLAASYPYMAQRLLTDPSPQLRESLEELVLTNGKLRWNRFENLLNEGSKSKAFETDGLWLLLDWLCSEKGANVRGPATKELISILDGTVLGGVRQGLGSVSVSLADRVAPIQTPADADSVAKAESILKFMSSRLELPGLPSPGDEKSNKDLSEAPQLLPSTSELREIATRIPPEELPTILVENVRTALNGTRVAITRFQDLMETPGGRDLANSLATGLAQRALARAVRAVTSTTSGGSNQNQNSDVS
mmetsp:Transcript_12548/g.18750  ORF Transcript_12548/g.18750 Transcript_12548/m.18750 type:complete len:797 (+) Transcript_12548:48-2438(+)